MSYRPLTIKGITFAAGTSTTVELPVGKLYTHAPMTMPVHVVKGKRSGPRLFISAAIHGDEINGVEIIRRLLKLPALKRLRGTIIAVPIVNVDGLINHSRYLPDRCDLNRSFPGSEKGSIAARLARLLMSEIVSQSTHGIDLHNGAIHRSNLPQIRANLDDDETDKLARAFNFPVIISANLRDCYDHTIQILDLIENYREMAASLIDIYISSTSYRLNEIMRVLTIIATIFIPLTFVVRVYGMNFNHPDSPWAMPELHWYYSYPMVWGTIIALVTGMVIYFKRKDWF